MNLLAYILLTILCVFGIHGATRLVVGSRADVMVGGSLAPTTILTWGYSDHNVWFAVAAFVTAALTHSASVIIWRRFTKTPPSA